MHARFHRRWLLQLVAIWLMLALGHQTVVAEPIQAELQLFTDRAAFEAKIGPATIIGFDDVDTPKSGHLPIESDRYKSKGIVITGAKGQYVSRDFGDPKHFLPVSAPNSYAPGPVDDRGAKANKTMITFVDGAGQPAAVAAFGCCFIDCNYPSYGESRIEVLDRDGRVLTSQRGFSGAAGAALFVGFAATDASGKPVPAIARVRLVTGAGWVVAAHRIAEGVTIDDLMFSEPQPPVSLAGAFSSDVVLPPPVNAMPELADIAIEPEAWNCPETASPTGQPSLLKPLAHFGGVQAVKLSPDGQLVATLTDKGLCIVWNLTAKQACLLPVKQMSPHAAFSADGKTLLTQAGGRMVVWDAVKLVPLSVAREKRPNHTMDWQGATSVDLRRALTFDWNPGRRANQWSVRDSATGEVLVAADGNKENAALSSDGSTLALADNGLRETPDGVRLFDAKSGKQREGIRGIMHPSRLALSFDGAMLAVGDGYDLTIWDLTKPTPRLVQRFPGAGDYRWALSCDGRSIAFPSGNVAILWDVASAKPRARLPASYQSFFSRNGKILMNDRSVFDAATGSVLMVLDHAYGGRELAANGDAVGWLREGAAVVQPLAKEKSGQEAQTLTDAANYPLGTGERYAAIREVTWSPDARFAALRGGTPPSGKTFLLEIGTGKDLLPKNRVYDPHRWGFVGKSQFAIGVLEFDTFMIDLESLRTSMRKGTPNAGMPANRTAVSPDGTVIAVSGADRRFTALATPLLAKTTDVLLEESATMLAFSPDGKRLAAAVGVNDRYQVYLFDVTAGKGAKKPIMAKAESGLAFGDANTLVTWNREALSVFDAESGQLKYEHQLAKGHRSQHPQVAVCPGKPFFATAGGDGDLLIKDLVTGAIRQRIAVDADITTVSFSPDGKRLVGCLSKEVLSQRGSSQSVLSVKTWKVGD